MSLLGLLFDDSQCVIYLQTVHSRMQEKEHEVHCFYYIPCYSEVDLPELELGPETKTW